jgi:hypothetical protein
MIDVTLPRNQCLPDRLARVAMLDKPPTLAVQPATDGGHGVEPVLGMDRQPLEDWL